MTLSFAGLHCSPDSLLRLRECHDHDVNENDHEQRKPESTRVPPKLRKELNIYCAFAWPVLYEYIDINQEKIRCILKSR